MKVQTLSAPAAAMVGQIAGDGQPQLAGVVIACANSRKPGGCGNTEECLGCIFRNTATATFADGIARHAVSTAHTLLMKGGKQDVVITFSVERANEGVLIYIEDIRPRAAAADAIPSIKKAS